MYLDVHLPGDVAAIETWPLLGSRYVLDLFREKPYSCDHLPPGETAQHLTANPATLLFLARNPAVFLVTESPERLLLYAEGATSAPHFHDALARVSGAWAGFADALQQPVQFVWRVSRAMLEVHENFFSSSDVDEQARACFTRCFTRHPTAGLTCCAAMTAWLRTCLADSRLEEWHDLLISSVDGLSRSY